MFIVLDWLSAHLQMSEQPQTHTGWFLTYCGKLVNQNGAEFKIKSSKPYKIFPRNILSRLKYCPIYSKMYFISYASNHHDATTKLMKLFKFKK